MSQREYATLLTWFRNDLNDLDAALPEPPPPSTCTPYVDTAAMQTHLDNMRFEGWQAINEDMGIRMFGCTAGADPRTCFTSGEFADESGVWGNGTGTIRNLRELDFRTSFWMRSSADGRFVGNGGRSVDGYGSTITDLLTDRNIGVDASYDPAFFPDNSGWMFQGGGNGAGFCTQSVLESGEGIDFDEVGCNRQSGISLYQHVARGLNGGDYFVINSQNKSNAGRRETTHPSAAWTASATMTFHPMVFDGTNYERLDEVIVDAPFEGDSVLSPSGQLVGSRMAGPDGESLGYVVRRVETQRFGEDYRITLSDPVAQVCSPGAKTAFSFDERFMVTHLHQGDVANIAIYDLLTGDVQQITDMPTGMRALFPHFRSDGWIYFLVIDTQNEREFIGASDAAILLAGA